MILPVVIYFDCLDILSPDINDRLGLREKTGDALGMAGDFCELLIGKRNVDSSITCRDNVGDGLGKGDAPCSAPLP